MNEAVTPNEERYDFARHATPMNHLLRPLTWLLSFPDVISHRAKITKVGMEGLKPPYLVLVNHNSFFDFKVVTAALYPHRYSNVVAIDGFIGREWLLRAVGCICKRKFTKDAALVRQLVRMTKRGQIVVLYPEARYSLCGTQAILPSSLAKLVKLLRVPAVVMINHGHHLTSPFWNLKPRRVATESVMTKIVDASEIADISIDEIARRINETFHYNDFEWQKLTGRVIDEPFRAEGLHKVLYQCPHCGAEYQMDSEGAELFCNACGRRWHMSELGELSANEGETKFSHIPDWYEWERMNVRREVENGSYCFESEVEVHSLPNAKKFLHIGKAVLRHDMDGFTLTGADYSVHQKPASTYSVHIEYEYLGKYGDCIDLNTDTDTLYAHPLCERCSVTKIALATEELYKHFVGDDTLLCLPKIPVSKSAAVK